MNVDMFKFQIVQAKSCHQLQRWKVTTALVQMLNPQRQSVPKYTLNIQDSNWNYVSFLPSGQFFDTDMKLIELKQNFYGCSGSNLNQYSGTRSVIQQCNQLMVLQWQLCIYNTSMSPISIFVTITFVFVIIVSVIALCRMSPCNSCLFLYVFIRVFPHKLNAQFQKQVKVCKKEEGRGLVQCHPCSSFCSSCSDTVATDVLNIFKYSPSPSKYKGHCH